MKKEIERAPEKEIIELPCTLTKDELIECAKKQSEAVAKTKRLEEELESYRTQKKADIALQEAIIQATSDKINTGREYRPVECEIRWDFKKGTKSWWRTDNGEKIREGKIPDHEMQERMI